MSKSTFFNQIQPNLRDVVSLRRKGPRDGGKAEGSGEKQIKNIKMCHVLVLTPHDESNHYSSQVCTNNKKRRCPILEVDQEFTIWLYLKGMVVLMLISSTGR